MKFNGYFNTLSDIKNKNTLATLQSLLKDYDWNHDSCLSFNKGHDPAFNDSHCIHFTPSSLMCHIRPTYSQNYTESTLELIKLGEILLSEIDYILPDHYHLKSHFVAIKPYGKQVRHTDGSFYHAHSTRLVVPISTTDLAISNFDDINFNLKEGTIYEMNNRIPHWSENNDNEYRVFLFADFISSNRLTIVKHHYNFKD